jgi:hypothetical protein
MRFPMICLCGGCTVLTLTVNSVYSCGWSELIKYHNHHHWAVALKSKPPLPLIGVRQYCIRTLASTGSYGVFAANGTASTWVSLYVRPRV